MNILGILRRKLSKTKNDIKWMRKLKDCEKQAAVPIKPLSADKKKEIKNFYASFGFNNIKTDWHSYIYSVSGQYSPLMIPENFFHGVLERLYNTGIMYYAWEDKAFMPFILSSVKFPETIFSNVNGYYFDKNGEMITHQQAKDLILESESVFAKPTIKSGGGNNAMLIENGDYEKVFNNLQKNYIVQKKIVQSKETAVLNPSSVNTEKVVSKY